MARERNTFEDYHRAVLLLEIVAERVRDLKAESDTLDATAKHAIALNGAGYAAMVEGVAVHRRLANALVDGAGHRDRVQLANALSTARQWLENGRPEPDSHRSSEPDQQLDLEPGATVEVEVLEPEQRLER